MKRKRFFLVCLSVFVMLSSIIPIQLSFAQNAGTLAVLLDGVTSQSSSSDTNTSTSDGAVSAATTWAAVSTSQGGVSTGSAVTTGTDITSPGAVTSEGGIVSGGAITSGAAVTPTSIYTDTANHWAESIIREAAELGLVNGYEDGSFRPNNNITREEFYKLIVCILTYKYETSPAAVTFTDLNASAWYMPYIATAVAAGLTEGYEDGTFGIGKNITRQEAAKAAGSLIDAHTINNNAAGADQAFDSEEIAEWALPYVDLMYKKKYVSGDDQNNFRPNDTLTRAEATTIILNIKKNETEIGNNPVDLKPIETTGSAIDNTVYEKNDCTELHGHNKNVFNEGRGTKSNPYIIHTEYQLNHIREHLSDDCYFVLANDIAITQDFTTDGGIVAGNDYDWRTGNFEPLGSKDEAFKGIFDGSGYTISNLSIKGVLKGKTDQAPYAALFGATDEDSEILNLAVSDSIVTGGTYVGGIVAYNAGLVNNCSLGAGSEITASNYAGGICGTSLTLIEECFNEGIVECKNRSAGGIVGSMNLNDVCVRGCVNNGTVIGGSAVGGIIGTLSSSQSGDSIVEECTNAGKVQTDSVGGGIAGALAGANEDSVIRNCKNTGILSGTGVLGGIAGETSENGCVENCVNYGSITGGAAGGIVGNNLGEIAFCYNKGIISASSYAGGIVSNNMSGATVLKNYNNGQVSAASNAGGIAGENTASISNCYNSGEVIADKYAGGLFGKSSGNVSKCYNSGTVTGASLSGLIGGSHSGTLKYVYWLSGQTLSNEIGEADQSSNIENCRALSIEQMKGGVEIYGVPEGFIGLLNQTSSSSAGADKEVWEYISGYDLPHLTGLTRE